MTECLAPCVHLQGGLSDASEGARMYCDRCRLWGMRRAGSVIASKEAFPRQPVHPSLLSLPMGNWQRTRERL